MLDLDFVRAQFPALETDWTLFDNAGGSVPLSLLFWQVSVSSLISPPISVGNVPVRLLPTILSSRSFESRPYWVGTVPSNEL